jgi:type IV pilus assembly protein PilP
MLAVVPQTMATDTGFVRAHKSLDVHAPTDPFSSQTWLNTQRAHAAQHPSYERWVAPELLRARNVLEAYPRERLQYVGYLASKGELEALINVLPPPGVPQDTSVMSVHRVRVGQHLGQDFGKLLAVESDQLVVQALALSPTGEWHPHVVRWPLHKVTP